MTSVYELGLYTIAAALGVAVGSALAPGAPRLASRLLRSAWVAGAYQGDAYAAAIAALSTVFHVMLALTVLLHAPLLYSVLAMSAGDSSAVTVYLLASSIVRLAGLAAALSAASLLALRLYGVATGRASIHPCPVVLETLVVALYLSRSHASVHLALAVAALTASVLGGLHAVRMGKLFARAMLREAR